MEAGLETRKSRRQFQYAYGINDGVNPVQETSGAAVLANILSGLGVDEFLTRTDVVAGATSHFLPDGLGSTLALADSAGALQTEYTYEPFGRTTASGVSSSNPFQFTGRENDGTGLYYYRARYYHPALQRFITEDPIEFFGGDVNLYTYVGNNAPNFVDPFGLAMTIPIPPGCRRTPPPGDNPPPGGRKDPSEPPDSGSGNPLLDALRDFACDPSNIIPGPGIVKGPTQGMIRQFERQLAKDGARSLEKAMRSLEQRLAEHLQKIAEATGHTSSIETEIRNFQAQIEAIKRVLGR